jgi:hypothetical protein
MLFDGQRGKRTCWIVVLGGVEGIGIQHLEGLDLYNLIDWRIPRPNIQQAHTDEAKIWLKVCPEVAGIRRV